MIINDKPDLKLNLELWGKKYNILFITGLSGSGKTQLSKEISSKNNAKIIHLDELQFFITRGIFNNMNTFVYKYIKENDIKYADNKKLNFYMTRFKKIFNRKFIKR
jgi:uridine kinase